MSRHRLAAAAAGAIIVLTGATVQTFSQGTPPAGGGDELRPVSSFAGIADTQSRSLALFQEAGKVLKHPRCVNCHPAGDRPAQGDRMQPHQPVVVRGKDGHGAPGLACATCHGRANFDPARVPGDPHWHLAPISMAWEGKSLGSICNQLKDPRRNGNRDVAAILKHVLTDSLVRWAWDPGPGRTPAPGSNAEFGALLQAWADTGAHCPAP
ncbi:MAG: Isoquinoline 1-oxidoreductase subunit [Hyphomonadaceae bacterium]|nr:Isoquinoline 1-oxidoreductase subunit [Hyphomonadaceae bacterium]